MTEALRLPEGLDTSKPSPALIYDYMLRGTHHFDVDEAAARRQPLRAGPRRGLDLFRSLPVSRLLRSTSPFRIRDSPQGEFVGRHITRKRGGVRRIIDDPSAGGVH